MKKTISYTLLAVVILMTVSATADAQDAPFYQQFVHYTIRCDLNVDRHVLKGSETIEYTNNSPDTLTEFYLHLYPNAYKDKNTPFAKDYLRRYNYSIADLPAKHRGETRITELTIDGQAVSVSVDGTIASMLLPRPLPPGGTMTIDMKWWSKVRKHLGRAGYDGKHYDMAQWYPKVVVYDTHGWNKDQFMTGEFYGEFGEFDVHITLPENYVLAATGMVQSGDPGWDLNPVGGGRNRGDKNKRKTVHFRAEDVHDFAWVADPDYMVERTKWNGVDVNSFYRKGNKRKWRNRNLELTIEALEWLKNKVGQYPYPQVSVCDALLRGGMEYPMLVMNGRVDESLIVHEVGHIYFYGIFGNNERTEAWLDEGFTTFQTSWYMIEKYGAVGDTEDWTWYRKLLPHNDELERKRKDVFALQRTDYHERVATRAEEFQNSYRVHVYNQAALMFFALKYVVGEADFDAILKKYFEEWKFKHVNEARFRKVCQEVTGEDLTWFFNEWLHSRKVCDYKLKSVKTSTQDGGYKIDVTIDREGEIIMPLQLEFEFDDGSRQSVELDGRKREITQTFNFPEKPKRTALNPNNEIMDIAMANNFKPRKRSLQVDWPRNQHYPESSMQIRHRPWVWYNDIDGMRLGYVLKSSYYNWAKRMRLAVYYGLDSKRMDFDASYLKPFRGLGRNGSNTFSGYKLEGRQDFTYELNYNIRSNLIEPPTHQVVFGVNYHELTDPRYPRNVEETYQTGADFAPYFGYRADPQFDLFSNKIKIDVRLGRKWFGGKWDYSNFRFELVSKSRPQVAPFDFGWRLFFGNTGGSMPYQQKHYLAGGGPLAEEKVFFLRSVGGLPEDFNYHEPGGGNLRGYYKGDFGLNKLLAFNFEFGGRIPLLSLKPNKLWGELKVMGFGDVGWTNDKNNPIGSSERTQALTDAGVLDKAFLDAGAGLRWHRRFSFWDLYVRFDVPAWVNQPIINGESDETRRRYVFSLKTTF